MADLFWGWSAHQTKAMPQAVALLQLGLSQESVGVLWQNNPVFGMLSWVISGCSGKGAALDSRAGLCASKR